MVAGSRGVGEAVVRPRQILLRDRAHDVGRHQHHQLGLPVDVVAALEQRAEHRKLHQAGNAVDLLLGLLLDHAGHGERAAGGNFHRGLGAPGLDRRDGQRLVWSTPIGCVSVSEFSFDSSDTSVITLRLMRPSDSTTGVKFRPTPNFLNWIWIWQLRVVGSQV